MFQSRRARFGVLLGVCATLGIVLTISNSMNASASLVLMAVFILALCAATLGLAAARLRLRQPLADLARDAWLIASGDLGRPVTEHGSGDLARLAQGLEAIRVGAAASHGDLEARVTQRTRELSSAFELSREIIAHLDLEQLLRSVTERARALTRSDAASLCLLDERAAQLTLAASDGDETPRPGHVQSLQHAPAGQVIGAGQTVAIETACATCGFLSAHAPGQCAAAPLQVGDRILGALCVVRSHSDPFDVDETRALTLLANSAAIAITNARLVEEGRQQAEQSAALAERERLAAELHDHLAQTLSFLNLRIDRVRDDLAADRLSEALEGLDRMNVAVGEASGRVRAALLGLHEPAPAVEDLAEKLSACVADFREASGLPAELTVSDPAALSLPRVAQVQALHIVREALSNVRRHAQASHANVRVERLGDEVVLTVQDDGRGFDPVRLNRDNHYGLIIMRARAERSGGSVSIESPIGRGTTVMARFPLATTAPGEVAA